MIEKNKVNFKQSILTITALIPFAFSMFITMGNPESLSLTFWIALCFLTFISGVGLTSNNRHWNIIGWGSTILLFLIEAITGYYDYLQWTTTIIGVITLAFFTTIYFINRTFNKTNASK